MAHSSHQVVNHPEPEPGPSLPSPLPALQPVDSQESIDLDDVPGGNKQDNVRVNNPDAIRKSKKQAAPDVCHFFDKTIDGDKVYCSECM